MESSSLKEKCSLLGFTDLHSFKDYVVYVLSCAPDMFPPEDWRPPEDQMNLERAFVGLHYGLDLTTQEKGESDVVTQCRTLVEDAYAAYRAGDDMEGQRKLEEVEKLLKKIPSR